MTTHDPPAEFWHDFQVTEKSMELFDRLCALFLPYVEEVVRPILEKEFVALEFTGEGRSTFELFLKMGGLPDEVCAQVIDEIERNGPDNVLGPIDDEVKEYSGNMAGLLVSCWLALLERKKSFNLESLGIDMLPFDTNIGNVFPDMIADGDSEGILRAVWRDLPPGKKLPDDAMELLKLLGATIT